MDVYAIEHVPSGGYLPYGTGGTYVDPSKTEIPRLFKTARAASIALTYWLKGHACRVTGTDDDFFGNQITVVTGVGYTPVEGRRREDMRVVLLELT